MKSLKKHWKKVFIGSILILFLSGLALEKFYYVELDEGYNFLILFIFILLFIIDGIVTFDKKYKIVSTLNLVVMLFIGIKFSTDSIKILNTTYSDEVYRVVAISEASRLLTWVSLMYFTKDAVINSKKSKKEDNELPYEVIEKTKE